LNDEAKEGEIDGSYDTHGREMHTRFLVGNLERNKPQEDLDADGTVVLKWNVGRWDGDVDCIRLAQDRPRSWLFSGTLMNLHFPHNVEGLTN
jgi:hypothetical protein